ncbi:MAG TPA: hypothetical protein VIK28_10845, partial [Sedimentisphaerales bacterium]
GGEMSIAQNSFREKCLRTDSSALARCAKPARSKTIRTIGNLLILNRTNSTFRQPNQRYKNAERV